ncbi:MAG: hypothetical protein AB1499_17320 [Nitrospirota bacterium]
MLKPVFCSLLLTIALSIIAGCTTWSPSDDEAVRMVKDYYLFYYSGKEVDVKIIRRGEYLKENGTYPIEFMIVPPEQKGFQKTFYFFKTEQGKIAVREFQY